MRRKSQIHYDFCHGFSTVAVYLLNFHPMLILVSVNLLKYNKALYSRQSIKNLVKFINVEKYNVDQIFDDSSVQYFYVYS